MRCSSNRRSASSRSIRVASLGLLAALSAGLLAAAFRDGEDPPRRAEGTPNLLTNPGFEFSAVEGGIPQSWKVVDENADYFGWIAPRAVSLSGNVRPRSGRFMAACDTESMGVDSNGEDYPTPRGALFQTISVPAGVQGTFSVYYNDLGSSALGHISSMRLGYTIESEEIGKLRVPTTERATDPVSIKADSAIREATWSRPFFRVSQRLPYHTDGIGDWALASIPVAVPEGSQGVRLSLWIGIFDQQNSTEVGYWRVDDASFRLEQGGAGSR
jgi:hypothetical protein